jgi:hypothetical protein
MREGNLKAGGLAISLALATLALLGCGSGSGGDQTTTGPALSAATAGHLAKLSDRIATDLDTGDTCSAAHAADDLDAAVQDAHLPPSLRSGVGETTGRLVDEVNCPPPPPPPEPKKKKDEHGKKKDEHGGDTKVPPGHVDSGGLVPPGQAKLKGEQG